jgi:hypothetical protein
VKGNNKNPQGKSQYRSVYIFVNRDVPQESSPPHPEVCRPASADYVLTPEDAGGKYKMSCSEIAAQSAV